MSAFAIIRHTEKQYKEKKILPKKEKFEISKAAFSLEGRTSSYAHRILGYPGKRRVRGEIQTTFGMIPSEFLSRGICESGPEVEGPLLVDSASSAPVFHRAAESCAHPKPNHQRDV